MSRQICLFGGTFDPIHCAHLAIAEKAWRRFALDQVLLVPAGVPPHKDNAGITPYEDRFEMVRLACAPYPAFAASRLEAGQRRSYTIDTVTRFQAEVEPDDQLLFLIGADAFDEIESWNRWQDLIRTIEFIVVARPGRTYRVPPGARVRQLSDIELDVSSSSVRARLAAGEPTPELPAPVRAYIEARGLYGYAKQGSTVSQ